MFSAFILGIQCTTVEDGDSCCFKSNTNGAICIGAGNTNARGDTYRINEADWTTITGTSISTQADYVALVAYTGSKVDTSDPSLALEYFDYAGCTTAAGVHTCWMWQPNWGQDANGNNYESDGYPRLGLDEVSLSAGYIDKSSSAALVMSSVTLTGAIQLAAAGFSALVFAMF